MKDYLKPPGRHRRTPTYKELAIEYDQAYLEQHGVRQPESEPTGRHRRPTPLTEAQVEEPSPKKAERSVPSWARRAAVAAAAALVIIGGSREAVFADDARQSSQSAETTIVHTEDTQPPGQEAAPESAHVASYIGAIGSESLVSYTVTEVYVPESGPAGQEYSGGLLQ